jgi:HAD superfamily hydrolase (TIGR01490 family)
MEKSRNIVVFDFCETLTKFQTADRFVDFVLNDTNFFYSSFLNLVYKVLIKLRFIAFVNKFKPKWNLSKRLYLLKLRGVSEQFVRQKAVNYLNEIILPGLNSEIYNKFKSHKDNGDLVIISSGGYEPYLSEFCKSEKIEKLFCTNIEFKNGIATGFILGSDCMFDTKVHLIEEFIKSANYNITDSIVYSDSKTDFPLLQWASKAYVISYNKSQMWPNEVGLNEIILNR